MAIRYPKGFAVIEIIVTLGLVAFLVMSVGSLLDSSGKLEKNSELQTQALLFAQESMEIVNANKNLFFACTCAGDSCSGSNCTSSTDGQACSMFDGYTSCWTPSPRGLAGKNTFYLEKDGTSWHLKSLDSDPEAIGSQFTRTVRIENVTRNADGDIDTTGTIDINTKKITVIVNYMDRGNTHDVELSTIITDWQNI